MQVITERWPKWAVTKVADGKPNWATPKFPEGTEVPFWIKLAKPPIADRWLKVSQCNANGEIREIDGKYWCISRATT